MIATIAFDTAAVCSHDAAGATCLLLLLDWQFIACCYFKNISSYFS